MKVRVDAEACEGHGRCYELAPEVFQEDERGHCRIEREDLTPELLAPARLGVANCPEKAIRILDDEPSR